MMQSVDLARRQLATRGGVTDLEVAVGEVATMLRTNVNCTAGADKHAKRFRVPDAPTRRCDDCRLQEDSACPERAGPAVRRE